MSGSGWTLFSNSYFSLDLFFHGSYVGGREVWKEDGNHFVTFFTFLFWFLPFLFCLVQSHVQRAGRAKHTKGGKRRMKGGEERNDRKKGHMQLWFVMGRQMGKGSV